jgi:hypothetical protein
VKEFNDMKRKRKRSSGEKEFEQISFGDIHICIGDKLYMDGKLYAEIMGESEDLYFLQKSGSSCEIASPYFKDTIIENILFGKFLLERLHYQ